MNIISEIYVKVNFHLISFLSNKLDNIKFVYSHPVALKQVKGFLECNPQIKSFEYTDTAGSVKFIQKSFFNQDKIKTNMPPLLLERMLMFMECK